MRHPFNPDLILLTDGSYRRGEKGHFQAGCAVFPQYNRLESGNLSHAESTQRAELHASPEHTSYQDKWLMLIPMAGVPLESSMILECSGDKGVFLHPPGLQSKMGKP